MKSKVLKNLPFSKDEYVILAVSGGRDSLVLLDLFYRYGQKIVVCHTNHHQRKASEIEEAYIKKYCKECNIPLEIDEYYPESKENFQAIAHEHRYEFFYSIAKNYSAKYILTAHHLDDQAETIILRLIQGSNLYGYGGISKITPYKDVFLFRPLLEVTRKEINQYVIDNNIKYFEDESNSENHYLRNRIRHQIIPLLKEENQNILNTLNNFSSICKESFDFIRSTSTNYLKEHNNSIEVNSFKKLHIAVKKDVICYLLEKNNLNISNVQINSIISLILSNKAQLNYSLGKNLFLKKRYNIVSVGLLEKETISSSKTIALEETISFLDKYQFHLTKNTPKPNANYLKLCYNDIRLPLLVRTRQQGDVIKLKYGTKKVKDLLIDKKIPSELRNNLPIVTDSSGEIFWVYGCAKKNIPEDEKNIIYLICEV